MTLAPEAVRTMFDRIAPVYDSMNRVMTAGLDRTWRRLAVEAVVQPGDRVLDACCGTGDLAFLAESGAAAGSRVVGLDFTLPMLAIARTRGRGTGVGFAQGDALRLPFRDAAFDAGGVARSFSAPAAKTRLSVSPLVSSSAWSVVAADWRTGTICSRFGRFSATASGSAGTRLARPASHVEPSFAPNSDTGKPDAEDDLGGIDALFLHLETADTPMHVGALHLLDAPAGGDLFAALRRHVAGRLPASTSARYAVSGNQRNPAAIAPLSTQSAMKLGCRSHS